jgi:hypothetical protein
MLLLHKDHRVAWVATNYTEMIAELVHVAKCTPSEMNRKLFCTQFQRCARVV